MNIRCFGFIAGLILCCNPSFAKSESAHNPIIYADVPDMSMIRVGDTWYRSSTTMHMSPGVPIMKSKDLVNWKLVNYASNSLGDLDELNLTNGKSNYGKGSWASCLRYHNGIFYISTFSQATGKTCIYSTKDIEKGPWIEHSFKPAYHDHSLFFDDDRRVYLIYGAGKLRILDLPASKGLIPGIVNNDEFTRNTGEPELPLVWQWNHNPDHRLWSVSERKGYLRLKTGRIDTLFVKSRNTLTQRTFGPQCSGSTLLDVSNLKDGDFAGLCAFQRKFGQVGVKIKAGTKYILMVSNQTDKPVEIQSIPLSGNKVYLKIECNFLNEVDIANFYYSLDGKKWTIIGGPLKMEYTLMEHFMGYRFGLFNYASKSPGGFADFDYFHISDKITNVN